MDSPFVKSLPWLIIAAALIAIFWEPAAQLLSRLGILQF